MSRRIPKRYSQYGSWSVLCCVVLCCVGVVETDSNSDEVPTTSANKTLTNRFSVLVTADKQKLSNRIDECPPRLRKEGARCICCCRIEESDSDSDKDVVLYCRNECPTDIDKTVPGVRGCGEVDTDSESDDWCRLLEGSCLYLQINLCRVISSAFSGINVFRCFPHG
jgi:hypothetical protein